MNNYFSNAWAVTVELAPWLFVGLIVAGLMHRLLPASWIRQQLGGHGFGSVIRAVCIGTPMPLCSCSVIPAAISLRQRGAGNGACLGFLISTPQTGADSIAVSAAFFGWPFAIYRVVAAVVTGLIGGGLANLVPAAASAVTDQTPEPTAGNRSALAHMDELLAMLWHWLLIGIAVSALIATLLPPNALGASTWSHGLPALLAALLISLPLYVCATASVPIAAALVAAGLPAGAALVFLTAGPATNVATMGAIYRAFGGRLLSLYLTVIVVASIAFGLFFDTVLRSAGVAAGGHHHAPGWLASISGAVFLLLCLRYAWQRLRRLRTAAAASPHDITLNIEGMNCNGCVRKVTQALERLPGVDSVQVDLTAGVAAVRGRDLDAAAAATAVTAAGFTVTEGRSGLAPSA